ncbi:hypothetical protein WN66_04631 [Saccharomyces cerevisiae]|uniref:Putative uncharacterized protein YLR428C n=2 Tax=Saccharomyces cerevisiae TaxID=4932 RepID=YL428_YEAST|nr:RecName: Full=Putative uncharacterized protein YLR428C [Saccharomyces cerevisiae S288C]AAB67512.1 Ylr428cp [Saccharomyces cerevisiae]KZV09679.1 hypothetical protein WN66_04631 [Saccharomyces cerevisiae]WNV73142.1 hypothetical protein O6U65_2027 [Saccharomyces cerevisiae synthetic construct]CAY81652.1 EC1118_1L7_3114p [Saccharomyces cerevisiae EC1118]
MTANAPPPEAFQFTAINLPFVFSKLESHALLVTLSFSYCSSFLAAWPKTCLYLEARTNFPLILRPSKWSVSFIPFSLYSFDIRVHESTLFSSRVKIISPKFYLRSKVKNHAQRH